MYLHPQSPQQGVLNAYYTGFGDELESLFARGGAGWHFETGIQIVRLILASVFDRFPNLQIVTGHWGEVTLFYLDRIDILSRTAKLPRKISEYFKQHISVTASGIFSQRYLQWAIEVLGPDRILFATDYPFELATRGAARSFMADAQLSEADRVAIASGTGNVCAPPFAAEPRVGR